MFAYLDPGTGSMLVQLLVGGVAAAAVAAKLYWYRILRLLRIRKDEPEPEQDTLSAEPGSFRDHESRVFITPDGVFRALSADGAGGLAGAGGEPAVG